GIRAGNVTAVQTCALPISNLDALVLVLSASAPAPDLLLTDRQLLFARAQNLPVRLVVNKADENPAYARELVAAYRGAGVSPMAEIGSASCRQRGEESGGRR